MCVSGTLLAVRTSVVNKEGLEVIANLVVISKGTKSTRCTLQTDAMLYVTRTSI